ncbi:MAG: hypothetical protein JXK94_02090 [Deltaproteobacteria bacterium]|nr:hypothetical protein [Deltaproteobacteria bacterium]
MSLLERLKAGIKNTKNIPFPGTDQEVTLRVLSNAELQEAHFAAERHFKKAEIEPGMTTIDAYEDEKTTQILFRALRDPEEPANGIASSASEFRGLLNRQEKDALVDEYTAFEMECSPRTEDMTEQEIGSLIEDVKKNPQTLGSVSNITTARKLIAFLVSRLPPSQKDSGSSS